MCFHFRAAGDISSRAGLHMQSGFHVFLLASLKMDHWSSSSFHLQRTKKHVEQCVLYSRYKTVLRYCYVCKHLHEQTWINCMSFNKRRPTWVKVFDYNYLWLTQLGHKWAKIWFMKYEWTVFLGFILFFLKIKKNGEYELLTTTLWAWWPLPLADREIN